MKIIYENNVVIAEKFGSFLENFNNLKYRESWRGFVASKLNIRPEYIGNPKKIIEEVSPIQGIQKSLWVQDPVDHLLRVVNARPSLLKDKRFREQIAIREPVLRSYDSFKIIKLFDDHIKEDW